MNWIELAQARETFAELQEEVRRMDVWICRLTGTLQGLLEPETGQGAAETPPRQRQFTVR